MAQETIDRQKVYKIVKTKEVDWEYIEIKKGNQHLIVSNNGRLRLHETCWNRGLIDLTKEEAMSVAKILAEYVSSK